MMHAQDELFPIPTEGVLPSLYPENPGAAASADPYADNERRAAERAAAADAGNIQTGAEQTGFHSDIVNSATGTSEPPRFRTRADRRPLSKRAGMDREAARAADLAADRLLRGQTGLIEFTPKEQEVVARGFAAYREELAKHKQQ